jgi:hypothetical protein
LGIGGLALGKDGTVFSKELRVFKVKEDTAALESTANLMNDTFSIPVKAGESVPPDVAKGVWDWAQEARSVADEVPGLQIAPGGGEILTLDPTSLKQIR